jgi:hypothetical protein
MDHNLTADIRLSAKQAQEAPLTPAEQSLIQELQAVSGPSIICFTIRRTVCQTSGATTGKLRAELRDLITMLRDQLRDAPALLKTIIGDSAFQKLQSI